VRQVVPVLRLVVRIHRELQVEQSRPVVVGAQRVDVGLDGRRLRQLQRFGRQHHVALQGQSHSRQGRLVARRSVDAVDADRDVPRIRKRLRKALQPPLDLVARDGSGQEQEVAPVEAGIVRGADHEMVAAVLDKGTGQLPHHQVGAETQRAHLHSRHPTATRCQAAPIG
jgi:hypothetical protein